MNAPDARTEAAAKALIHENILLNGTTYFGIASRVLATADAADAPLAENLAAALRDLTRRAEVTTGTAQEVVSLALPKGTFARALASIRSFDAARGDSQGTPIKETT